MALLRASQATTRQAALRVLRHFWKATDFEQVLPIMLRDHEDGVRKEAGWTLRKRASESDWAILFDCETEMPSHVTHLGLRTG